MDLIKRLDEPVEGEWRLGPLAYVPKYGWQLWLTLTVITIITWEIGSRFRYDALGITILVFGIPYACSVAYHRTVALYMDDAGVWVYRGLLPWKRGVYGLKWRDIESADFHRDLAHWATCTYHVRVTERFTEKVGVDIKGVWRGDEAVTRMNEKLMAMAKGEVR